MKPGFYQINMATCRLKYSTVMPAHLRGHMFEIVEMFVPEEHRGNGDASHLIRMICEEASRDGKVLMLMPEPYDNGMSKADLVAWYARHGFQIVQESPLLMARQA